MDRKSKAKVQQVCEEVLRKAIPSEKEKHETLQFADNLVKRLDKELIKAGFEAKVQVEGSIAKDTWLSGEKDIDLFILIPKACGREAFVEVLKVAKKVAGEDYIEAYAEHPYIEAKTEGFTVDFVPCFKLDKVDEFASSVDRTPFHTQYVKKWLSTRIKNEVRLLKRFMRGVGIYGAEIKVGGFSGYLCEVLILHYRSFFKLLKAASEWHEKEFIDLKAYYKGKESEVQKKFQEPFIVVDPVDKGRNVASAVRTERLNEFIAASRRFLNNPSLSYFYPQETEVFSINELVQILKLKGTMLIFIKTGAVSAVPDVLWGQLYRSQKAITNLINLYGFSLIHNDVWSDEKTANVFVFELYSRFLPAVEKHIGPPILKSKDSANFLEKHLASKQIISGPRIEGKRWVIERRRKYSDIVDLLKEHLGNGGEKVGIASLIAQAFSSSIEFWVNNDVNKFYSENTDFRIFLTVYLKGKPRWFV